MHPHTSPVPPARPAQAPRGRAAALLGLGLLLMLVFAAPAGAHAVLLSISPEPDALLESLPDEVVLSFNEPVSAPAGAVRVFDPSGDEVPGVESSSTDTTLRATLPELELDGSYTVAWKVVSADGHPLRGAYLFHLRDSTLTEPVDVALGGTAVWPSVLRAAGSILALGALTLALVPAVASRRGRRRSTVWGLALAGTVVCFVASLFAVGSSFGDALDVVMSTSTGKVAAVAIVVAVLGLVLSFTPAPARLLQGTALVAVIAIALEGHAVALDPVARSASLTVLHVVAASAWAAGLIWLELRARTATASELHDAVRRRSPVAATAVVVLAVTGAVLVLDRVPLGELLSAWYGRLALVKVALLGLAVILAVRNRTSLTPALAGPVGGDDGEQDEGERDSQDEVEQGGEPAEPADRSHVVRLLRASVRAEIVVLAVALVAGAALAQIPPPEGSGGGMFSQRAPFGDGEVELTVEPGARGTNEVHVTALGADGRLMAEVDGLELALTLPSEDVGPLHPEMQQIVPGHSVSYAKFPFSGEWTVTVSATIDRFTALDATFTVPIGG
jgi:copper transport protein